MRRDDETERDPPLEDIVAEFILRQEQGEEPDVAEYVERYPRHAEALPSLLRAWRSGLNGLRFGSDEAGSNALQFSPMNLEPAWGAAGMFFPFPWPFPLPWFWFWW